MIVRVPVLSDGVVTLRAPTDDDITGSLEQNRDPLSQRWTTAPQPFTTEDARTYLRHVIPGGWETDQEWGFVVEVESEGQRLFGGVVSLRNLGDRRAEIAYGSHPRIRGRGLMERALRLLVEWGYAERDLVSISWLARRGNWPSRRLAWRLGFTFEGTLRDWLPTHAEPVDAWAGTLRRGEDLSPRSPWLEAATIVGGSVVLRALKDEDLPRVVETLNDPETQRWHERPRVQAPHTLESQADFVLVRHEQAAAGTALHWAVRADDQDVVLFPAGHRRSLPCGAGPRCAG